MDRSKEAQIVGSDMTVSDKIRALSAGGYSRAEIARVLGKRYQHVRNVLEADRLATRPAPSEPPAGWGVEEPAQAFGGVIRLPVEPGGFVRLPPEVMAALGARPGGVLIAELGGDRLSLLSVQAAWTRAVEKVGAMGIAKDRLLSEELIADRRSEAGRDDGEG